MPFIETEFPGLMIYTPNVFEDNRGYFLESYNKETFEKEGINIQFVQDNQAGSSYGIIRGMHYQLNPDSQIKLLRVLSGRIIDAVVDLRKNSPTYGKSFSIELSCANRKQILIPKGFAHGYAVLSEKAEVFYKCDTFYNKETEAGLMWNDPALAIDWQIPPHKVIVSEKDSNHPTFENCKNNFLF
ncbi:MAG: dTDP-4-dehydrorhamnose 3,5-epimerase [Ginsengibacter sp.]|jgi:dTDP-4-dehydrorhamnose 3,5-epimerase